MNAAAADGDRTDSTELESTSAAPSIPSSYPSAASSATTALKHRFKIAVRRVRSASPASNSSLTAKGTPTTPTANLDHARLLVASADAAALSRPIRAATVAAAAPRYPPVRPRLSTQVDLARVFDGRIR